MRLQIPGGSPVRRRDCWSTPCFTGGYPWDGKGYPLGQTIAFSVRHVETEEQSFYLSDHGFVKTPGKPSTHFINSRRVVRFASGFPLVFKP